MTPMTVTDCIPHAPHLNALKHGLRSQATLLPGDSRAAFRALRDELFHLYQPCTADEAFCVSQMAKLQWRIRRCDRWQEVYDDQQDALLLGNPGLDSSLCEPDAHRSLHRPMDCELHAGRMDRRLRRQEARLWELQKLRRLNLIAGKAHIARDYGVFLAAERLQDPPAGQGTATGAEPLEDPERSPADLVTPSADGRNGFCYERPTVAPAALRAQEAPRGTPQAIPGEARNCGERANPQDAHGTP